jgi:MinD-like ATPase involved in chromosome partitioning or flagellar assembly
VTTNNDTPQIFSEGARDDGPFGREWRDEADGAAFPDDAGFPHDAGCPDRPAGAGWYGPWFGWETEAGDGYPQPPLYPGHPDYRPEPEYPRGPGYAPLPPDAPGPGELGYPAGPGYEPDAGYAHDLGYSQGDWTDPDPLDPLEPVGFSDPMGPLASSGSGYEYPPDPGYPPDGRQAPDSRYRGYAPEPDYGYDGFAGSGGRMPPSRSAPQTPAETSDSLTAGSLLHDKRSASGSGWRHRIYRVTGGLLRLGESAADMRRRDLINRVRTPVAGGHHRVAVLSLKGGVGKTTTAVGLGATFATLRGDRVIAVDANPDRGTLSDKVCLETAATVRDLLDERDQIRRYADLRAFTTQAPSRLEVLASDRDPAVSVAFSADDYRDAARVLEHFYSICLTDCGTGLLHSAMSGVLRLADQIVVVSSPSVDGARSASATLDWLEAHNCGDLVRNGVVVLSVIRPKSKSTVDLDRLEHHFAARCRAVARIPYDPHLEEGAEVDLELLSAETADAYLALAALVGDGLAWPRRLTARSGLP